MLHKKLTTHIILSLVIILMSVADIASAATVLHNTIKQAVWITFESIKYADKKSNIAVYYGEIEIVALESKHVNLDKSLKKAINGYNDLSYAFGTLRLKPKKIQEFVLLGARVKDIKMFYYTDSGYKRVNITNLDMLPCSVNPSRTNTLKLIETGKILIQN